MNRRLVHAMEANGGADWLRTGEIPAPRNLSPMYRRRFGADEEPISEDREMAAMMRTVHNRRHGQADPGLDSGGIGWLPWAALVAGMVIGFGASWFIRLASAVLL